MRCSGGRVGRPLAAQAFEPLEREEQMGAALRRRHGVDFVDDHRLDVAEHLARLRREQQVQRLGRRDENVRRIAEDLPAVGGGRVAGAHGDARQREGHAFALGDGLDADERRAQVAVDVDGQGLERRDVEDARREAS